MSGLWPVGCVRLGAKGRVIGRVSGCVSVVGCVSGRGRGLAPGGVARASVGGLLLTFARVAGHGARVVGRGMVYAYLAGRGPVKTVVGGYAYPVGLTPVFGDSLCGF